MESFHWNLVLNVERAFSYFNKKYSLQTEVTSEVFEKLLEFSAGHFFP